MTNRIERPNQFLDVSGSRLGYQRLGDGPDLLFVHGWPLHRATWRNVVPHLDDHTCHLLDLPGCGTSQTPPSTAVSFSGHIDATVEAIKNLNLDQVVLVAQDSGALIARQVAARLPGQVTGLVVSGTEIPGHHPKLIDRLQRAVRLPGSERTMARLLARPRIARHDLLLGGLFWDKDLIEGDFRTHVLDPVDASDTGLARQIEILSSYSHELVDELEAAHRSISCPTLLVWGEHDPFFPIPKARAMADQFAGPTRFEVIPKARLLVHEEHPEAYAGLIHDFVTDHDL